MTYYEEPDDIRPTVLDDARYLAALIASMSAARSIPLSMALIDPEEIARQTKKLVASEMERTAKSVKPIVPPRQRPDYPMIKASEIQAGDTVYLHRIPTKNADITGRYRIVKAKPIIGGRVQIKAHSAWFSSSKIQKINLDETASVELQERDGQSMDRNSE